MPFTHITQRIDFEDWGPCLIVGEPKIKRLDDTFETIYEFETLLKFQGEHRRFSVSRETLVERAKIVDTSFCCWIEDEELSKVKKGDEVFIFHKQKMQHAVFVGWRKGKHGNDLVEVKLYGERSYTYYLDPALVIYYYHKFEQIEGISSKSCKCGTIRTLKYKPYKQKQA